MSKILKKIEMAPRHFVKKGWGSAKDAAGASVGEVFVYHAPIEKDPFRVETVKLLHIEKDKKLSLHFHVSKKEIFYIISGCIEIELIHDGATETVMATPGYCCIIEPGMVHSMKGIDANNVLIEVSTLDRAEDSYRIRKGD